MRDKICLKHRKLFKTIGNTTKAKSMGGVVKHEAIIVRDEICLKHRIRFRTIGNTTYGKNHVWSR